MMGPKSAAGISFIGAVVLMCFAFRSPYDSRGPWGLSNDGNGVVSVDFYGESLCPDCRHMVLDILAPLYDSGVADLIDLKYIAYGKVKDGACQHGPVECKYNRHINCAQVLHPESWFPYVACLARDLPKIESLAAGCARAQDWEAAEVDDCAAGPIGEVLEEAAGNATRTLKPTLTNVPWIIVNGVPLGADFENLDRYICAAAGDVEDRPDACFDLTDRTRFH